MSELSNSENCLSDGPGQHNIIRVRNHLSAASAYCKPMLPKYASTPSGRTCSKPGVRLIERFISG